MIRIADTVLETRLDEELVLLDRDQGLYFGLNEIGARIWEAIRASGGTEIAIRDMLRDYGVDEQRLRADVERYMERLESAKLVTRDAG